jgi:hypothetical protein
VLRCRSTARSGRQDQDTREALHDLQRPAGWQPLDAATAAIVNSGKRP